MEAKTSSMKHGVVGGQRRSRAVQLASVAGILGLTLAFAGCGGGDDSSVTSASAARTHGSVEAVPSPTTQTSVRAPELERRIVGKWRETENSSEPNLVGEICNFFASRTFTCTEPNGSTNGGDWSVPEDDVLLARNALAALSATVTFPSAERMVLALDNGDHMTLERLR